MGQFRKKKKFWKRQTAYFSNLPLVLRTGPPPPKKQAPRGAPSAVLLFAHARDLGFLASCARPGGLFVAFFRPWPPPGPRSQFLAPGPKKEKSRWQGELEELGRKKKKNGFGFGGFWKLRFCRFVAALWKQLAGDSWTNWWSRFAALGPGSRLWVWGDNSRVVCRT